jgi:hypothetical protein
MAIWLDLFCEKGHNAKPFVPEPPRYDAQRQIEQAFLG